MQAVAVQSKLARRRRRSDLICLSLRNQMNDIRASDLHQLVCLSTLGGPLAGGHDRRWSDGGGAADFIAGAFCQAGRQYRHIRPGGSLRTAM